MKAILVVALLVACFIFYSFAIKTSREYSNLYVHSLQHFKQQQTTLLSTIATADLTLEKDRQEIKKQIDSSRLVLKGADFWLRYLEPVAYKKINGPLAVEWETEVFEKFENPYKREGAGLSLAELYFTKETASKDSLQCLIQASLQATDIYLADSITSQLKSPAHFFFANRLFLLNLAAVYTTGFECPDTSRIIPELQAMLHAVRDIYGSFDESFTVNTLPKEYLSLYDKVISFADQQPLQFSLFDHFTFIKEYINPLFAINQKLINLYGVYSTSFNDYTLNDSCPSIFNKTLYTAQNTKGIYSLIEDTNVLNEIRATGKLLFYDPILSGNNMRSCASCHKPSSYFTDTVKQGLEFDRSHNLARNTPSLINVTYNHLLMLDGKFFSLQSQLQNVMTNHEEMNCDAKEVVKKVMSCKEYKDAFKKYLQYTPEEKEVTISHIASAIMFYYGGFSNFYSPFDEAMNNNEPLDEESKKGFNLFMSKAQCGTCHFVPQFNGVQPPYISSEFEVLGVPGDTSYTSLGLDSGRYKINAAAEMMNAFKTGSIRNAEHTAPYMHNGVFKTLQQVIDFYDAGGGAGKKMKVANQTLSSDSLKLSKEEKDELLAFIYSLNEKIIFQTPPQHLPKSSDQSINARKVGGEY